MIKRKAGRRPRGEFNQSKVSWALILHCYRCREGRYSTPAELEAGLDDAVLAWFQDGEHALRAYRRSEATQEEITEELIESTRKEKS